MPAVPILAPEKPLPFTGIGFLTVLHEPCGYLGGYLVTNVWGRPLEFRLTSAVQPNRVQTILYAGTLRAYVCADLIGKTLIDKTSAAAQLIVTDRDTVLDLRLKVETPVLWLASPEDARAAALAEAGALVCAARPGRGPLLCHANFLSDVAAAAGMLERVEGLDLSEPFTRIREAIAEARKMGVTGSR
jgi:hypothetical protein